MNRRKLRERVSFLENELQKLGYELHQKNMWCTFKVKKGESSCITDRKVVGFLNAEGEFLEVRISPTKGLYLKEHDSNLVYEIRLAKYNILKLHLKVLLRNAGYDVNAKLGDNVVIPNNKQGVTLKGPLVYYNGVWILDLQAKKVRSLLPKTRELQIGDLVVTQSADLKSIACNIISSEAGLHYYLGCVRAGVPVKFFGPGSEGFQEYSKFVKFMEK